MWKTKKFNSIEINNNKVEGNTIKVSVTEEKLKVIIEPTLHFPHLENCQDLLQFP